MSIIYVDASRPDDTGNGLTPGTAKKTLRGARLITSSGGDTIRVMAGQVHSPISGQFLVLPATAAGGLLVEAYGSSSQKPIWDGLVYEPPGASGWTHVSSGIWKKVFGAWYVRRVFAGSLNSGILPNQRRVGSPLRRSAPGGVTSTTQNPSEASILASLSTSTPWSPSGSSNSFALYIFTGSSTTNPPDFYEGLAFIQADGVAYGSINHVELKNVSNVIIRDQEFRGSGGSAVRVSAANADSRNASNMLFTNLDVSYLWANGIRLQRFSESAPTWNIQNILVNKVNVDYSTSSSEQELTNGESAASGTGDAFVADAGVSFCEFSECYAKNPFHVGFAIGSSVSNLSLPNNCTIYKSTVEFSEWASYGRGLAVYNGADHIIERSLIIGQNVRSQFAGGVRVESNIWKDCRRSIRKPDTDQWVAVESYVFDSGAGANDVRYVFIQPSNVRLYNNTVTGVLGTDSIQLNSFSHAFPVAQASWPSSSISVINNLFKVDSSSTLLRATDGGGAAASITTPDITHNCFSTPSVGGTKVIWKGSNSSINSTTGFSSNIESNPLIGPNFGLTTGSPCLLSGRKLTYNRCYNGSQRGPIVSIGAVESARLTIKG